jgi:hypothetical protein
VAIHGRGWTAELPAIDMKHAGLHPSEPISVEIEVVAERFRLTTEQALANPVSAGSGR